MTRAADLPPHLADGMHPADCSCQQVRPMTTPTPATNRKLDRVLELLKICYYALDGDIINITPEESIEIGKVLEEYANRTRT